MTATSSRGWQRRLTLGRLWVSGVIAAVGCGQVLGVDRYEVSRAPRADGGTQDSGARDGAAAWAPCDACLSRECTDEAAACDADPSCVDAQRCERACAPGDTACASACAGIHLVGLRGPIFWDLLGCRARGCPTECGLPCDGLCTGNGRCDACLAENCPASTLLASSGGTALLACQASSLGLGAGVDFGQCLPDHPESGAIYGDWSTCFAGQCGNACSVVTVQPDFTCVGEVDRAAPAGNVPAIDVDLRVNQGPTGIPGPDLTVKLCTLGTGACDRLVGTTDADGRVSIHATGGVLGFFDYLELTDPAGAYDPTFMLHFPPINDSGGRILGVATPAATLDSYYAQAGATFDRARFGHIMIFARSCGLTLGAPGLVFESDLGGRPYYFTASFASSLDLTETSQLGVGGFIDLPEGLGTFKVKRKDDGVTVASFQAPIKIGYVTNAYVSPSPERGW